MPGMPKAIHGFYPQYSKMKEGRKGGRGRERRKRREGKRRMMEKIQISKKDREAIRKWHE